VINEKTLQGD
jgi:hypothetical protein